jgi:hypothetical protein
MFEALKSQRNRRLRAAEFLRRPRETAFVGHGHEHPERGKFHLLTRVAFSFSSDRIPETGAPLNPSHGFKKTRSAKQEIG